MTDTLVLSGKHFCSLLEHIETHPGVSMVKFKGYGQSMTPFIKNGNTISIKLLTVNDTIKTGDIVAVKPEDKEQIFIHRVITKKENNYLIKGDNRKTIDGWFQRSSIFGIVAQNKRDNEPHSILTSLTNRIIAFLSRTGLLNQFILPSGRWIKHTLLRKQING